jgi:hypothetical protein
MELRNGRGAPAAARLTFALAGFGLFAGCNGDRPDSVHSPASRRAALTGVRLDAKALVIVAGPDNTNGGAITAALDRLGTPFDVLDANQATFTADQLATGTHGHYQAIFLASADLTNGSATVLSAADWQALADYEAAFGVRRVSLSTIPDAGYGYAGYDAVDSAAAPITVACSERGAAVLARVNCSAGVRLTGRVVYLGRASASASDGDGATVPLLADGGGRIAAAIRSYPDGREALTLNFDQAGDAIATLQLLPDVIAWATRGVYLGERHTWIGVQLDDLFLPSALRAGGTYRITGDEMQTIYDWQQRRRRQPNQADLRLDWAVNAQGAADDDPLTQKARAVGPGFKWISHTYDHAEMDFMTYAQAFSEFDRNDKLIAGLGLAPFSVANLVTPGITGLHNADVMAAAYNVGVRYLIGDSSIADSDNPSFNAGLPDFVEPRLFIIPRRATDLDFDVSLPEQFLAEFNQVVGAAASYDALVDYESDILLRYLLRGENDPWMFHQANVRDHGGGASLLSDLLDRTFDQYDALLRFPFVSPTMDVLGAAVMARTAYAQAQVTAVIEPGLAITVQADRAVTVPVTGACGTNPERYAGDWIASVAVPAEGSTRVELGPCAEGEEGSGSGGGSGAPGTGGITGAGGEAEAKSGGGAGAGGTDGSGGAPGGGDADRAPARDAGSPPPRPATGCSCDAAPHAARAGTRAWLALAVALAVAVGSARRRRRRDV